jgi:hypothetical protein
MPVQSLLLRLTHMSSKYIGAAVKPTTACQCSASTTSCNTCTLAAAQGTLDISCAEGLCRFFYIVLQAVFGAYGIGVDPRHLGLIADFMTHTGGYR